jgi:hypothetical protein
MLLNQARPTPMCQVCDDIGPQNFEDIINVRKILDVHQ